MFEAQKRFIQEFESDVFFVMRMTFEEFDEVVQSYITERQLYERGIDGNNAKLRAYERTTIRIKTAKGQPTDRTTLKDTGAFHRSITVTAFADNVMIESNVPYDKYLLDPKESKSAYGFDVLKPSDQNLREFFETYFFTKFKKYIDDKFAR